MVATIAFIFLIGIFASRYGRLRLGDDDDEPEYSQVVWFSMLFAGDLGAVLMLWGVAEPLNHAYNVPQNNAEPMSNDVVRQAFSYTFYHFGVHMWVILALPGLALGCFIYKRKLPPRLSSVFSPLPGGRIYEWPGKLIDILRHRGHHLRHRGVCGAGGAADQRRYESGLRAPPWSAGANC